MIEAPALSTPTQRLLAARYAEIHRKFFPLPPIVPQVIEPPPPVVQAIAPPPEPPPMPKHVVRAIGFQETKARLKIIRRMVCKCFEVTIEDMMGTRRNKDIVLPRHVYSYMAARLTKASLPQIARSLGQDHTSILHAQRRIARKVSIEWEFAERLRIVEQRIRMEFGECEKPRGCTGRYVEHRKVHDYLLLGWMHAANLNEYAALLIWPCDCRFVEPKG